MNDWIMRTGTVLLLAAGLALAACGDGETVTEEETVVTDVDPGEADGTIDDTTAIDATIGADEDAEMDAMTGDGAGPDEMIAEEAPQDEAAGAAETEEE